MRKLPFYRVAERNKEKEKESLPKPLRRRGCAWRSKVGSRGLLVMSTGGSDVFHLLKGTFQRDGRQRVRKLPFYIVVERNKGKGEWGLPKPLRRRGCTWRDVVGNDDLLLKYL